MTQLLLRLFVKDADNTESSKVRSSYGRLSGIVGILCNVLLFAAKMIVGTLAGSVSITADAVNNLSDASSSLVTLIGFRIAEMPADANHPYGHARVEYLSGLAVSALILVIGVELGKSSLEKVFNPSPIVFSWITAAILIGSILVKLWLSLFNTKLGKRIDSAALLATAADSRNDVISTAAVLVAAVVAHYTGVDIDGYVGVLVALFIIWSGFGIAKDTIDPLLGQAPDPELRWKILEILRKDPRVLGLHDLMIHDYGPGQRFATVHVEMDMREDPMESHDLIDDMERACLEQYNVHLSIHYDPVVTDNEELNRMRKLVEDCIRPIDSRLSIHDFRMVQGPHHTNLIFDMILPYDMMKKQDEVKKLVDEAVRQENDKYYTVITFDGESFNNPEDVTPNKSIPCRNELRQKGTKKT